jgi:Ca2+/Na+ antiporter
MPRIAILFGALLIILGLVGYFKPDTLGEPGDKGTSPTALIPAVVGGILLLCGLIVLVAPHTRKHVMHLAALVGLLGAVGGIMPVRKMEFSKASFVAGVFMIVLCVIFLVLCVRSFVRARIARNQGLPETPPGT